MRREELMCQRGWGKRGSREREPEKEKNELLEVVVMGPVEWEGWRGSGVGRMDGWMERWRKDVGVVEERDGDGVKEVDEIEGWREEMRAHFMCVGRKWG